MEFGVAKEPFLGAALAFCCMTFSVQDSLRVAAPQRDLYLVHLAIIVQRQ